ncbi:DUF1194 domain-containing protein [Ahrensia sp. R2A130]|uniref:DUF1194 domain-containing protein n=1 Tax=Ahrensia sp. R2A130 TaxID=744979 RepID=UPI0001E08C82|nr:DUF1194 domain-containing protein [Ahrensia sp. R2A130]EFL89111.1 conserved hypothetical protein [Ahrensia sp. R2A130]
MTKHLARFALVSLLLFSSAGNAPAADVEVDVELVLAVDVSRSMSPRELEIQRRGYASALTSPEVTKAISSGLIGKIALTYYEWAGHTSQRTIIPWTLVETAADAEAIALKLTAQFNPSLRRTSISGAIDHGASLFSDNGYRGMRRVIDVSGDGPNNNGRAVVKARDAAVAQGTIINGLPLMTREGMGSRFHITDLDEYYRACVVGGPGSFVIPVRRWEEFPQAVRQKLVLELASNPVLPKRTAFRSRKANGTIDCMIGERIWNRYFRDWAQ